MKMSIPRDFLELGIDIFSCNFFLYLHFIMTLFSVYNKNENEDF